MAGRWLQLSMTSSGAAVVDTVRPKAGPTAAKGTAVPMRVPATVTVYLRPGVSRRKTAELVATGV